MIRIADYGNNIAASIPLTLDEAIRTGKLQRGQKLFMLGTVAGFAIGGNVLEY